LELLEKMIAVIQRVKKAKVQVGKEVVGSIGKGLVILLGIEKSDTQDLLDRFVKKIVHMRIFPDERGRMNKDILEAGGEILLVSQFTLLADVKKGRRPSFLKAADPNTAKSLFEYTAEKFSQFLPVKTGVFGEYMQVSLQNDGPVTFILTSQDLKIFLKTYIT